MTKGFSPGMTMYHRDYGKIAKCPYCDDTDIPRYKPDQKCCPKMECQRKQTNARARARARVKPRRKKVKVT